MFAGENNHSCPLLRYNRNFVRMKVFTLLIGRYGSKELQLYINLKKAQFSLVIVV